LEFEVILSLFTVIQSHFCGIPKHRCPSCRKKTWDSTVEVAVVLVTDSQGEGASMSKAALVPGPNGRSLMVEGLDQARVKSLGQGYFPEVQRIQPNYGFPFCPSVGMCPKAHPANIPRPSDPLIGVVDVMVQSCLKQEPPHRWPACAPE
jgi:hypothetical protein